MHLNLKWSTLWIKPESSRKAERFTLSSNNENSVFFFSLKVISLLLTYAKWFLQLIYTVFLNRRVVWSLPMSHDTYVATLHYIKKTAETLDPLWTGHQHGYSRILEPQKNTHKRSPQTMIISPLTQDWGHKRLNISRATKKKKNTDWFQTET